MTKTHTLATVRLEGENSVEQFEPRSATGDSHTHVLSTTPRRSYDEEACVRHHRIGATLRLGFCHIEAQFEPHENQEANGVWRLALPNPWKARMMNHVRGRVHRLCALRQSSRHATCDSQNGKKALGFLSKLQVASRTCFLRSNHREKPACFLVEKSDELGVGCCEIRRET